MGRVFHFAGDELKLLRVDNCLPYRAPDGTYRAGISYFHWWRTTGRWWSRSLVTALRDPQRANNKRATQENEIIDRGLPYVMAVEGSAPERQGTALEVLFYPPSQPLPTPVQGIGPGGWMQQNRQEIREDAERAAGIHAVSLGQEATRATTYSELALRGEKDQVKRKRAAGVFFDTPTREVSYGRQPEDIGETAIFVLSSTSGSARRFWDESHWSDLAEFARGLEGARPTWLPAREAPLPWTCATGTAEGDWDAYPPVGSPPVGLGRGLKVTELAFAGRRVACASIQMSPNSGGASCSATPHSCSRSSSSPSSA